MTAVVAAAAGVGFAETGSFAADGSEGKKG